MLKINVEHLPLALRGCKPFDVNDPFSRFELPDDEFTRRALKEIDGAEYFDGMTFIDRVGLGAPRNCLSSGCKLAIVVHVRPDLNVDLTEAGYNARDFIICNCSEGEITIWEQGLEVSDMTKNHDGKIDVSVDGEHFKNLNELNDYMF